MESCQNRKEASDEHLCADMYLARASEINSDFQKSAS